jgi:hypothetical protein
MRASTRSISSYFIGRRFHELGDRVPALSGEIGAALPQFTIRVSQALGVQSTVAVAYLCSSSHRKIAQLRLL